MLENKTVKNEKPLNRYTDLMKNIINIQEKKGKIENDGKKLVPNSTKATPKPIKQTKTKLPTTSNRNNVYSRIKKTQIMTKQNPTSGPNAVRTILKNSKSNENLKKIEADSRNCRKINSNGQNLRSRSADFISANRRLIPGPKTLNWNDLKSLISLHFSNQPKSSNQISAVIQKELEFKINDMKKEIDELKSTLLVQNQEVLVKRIEDSLGSPKKQISAESISNDLGHSLNLIISNYSEKLAQINQQILNLKKPDSVHQVESKIIPNTNHKEIFVKSAVNQDYVYKLENELKNYKEKCRCLEESCEGKTKQVEQYHKLFREISENVNSLILELEKKDDKNKDPNQAQTSISLNVTESKTISNLLSNLAKFEKTLKIEKDAQKPAINPNIQLKNSKDCSTTDTLIDADSSFADFADNLRRPNFNSREFNQQINFLKLNQPTNVQLVNTDLANHYPQNKLTTFQKPNNFIQKININTNLKNQFNDFYDDEDEEEKIVFSMEDLSITTIQTSNNTSESTESLLLLKNVQDDDFQKDLNILDEKILKVKKIIDSMKKP